MKSHDLGKQGEALAAQYLMAKGYQILARNYRTAFAEVDIIAQDGQTLVFAEVKARSSHRFGLPREAVTLAKQRRILAAAQHYLMTQGQEEAYTRFDVLEILGGEIRHLPNAFDATQISP